MNKRDYNRFELSSMTVNERLVVTGLLEEFDKVKKNNKQRAKEILEQIYVDKESIRTILKLRENRA